MRTNSLLHSLLPPLSFIFFFFENPLCSAQTGNPQWQALAAGLDGQVSTMYLDGDDLYVGGSFYNAGGIEKADFIARWDGTAWYDLGNGPVVGSVQAIAKLGDDLYIGGDFTSTGDDPNARFIARWDGDTWHSIAAAANIFNHPVWALAAFQDQLYIGGRFDNVLGLADADHLVRWDGQNFSSVGGGINLLNNGVSTLVADEQNLYVGGAFGQVGQVPNTRNIARWDGTNWHAMGEGFWGDMGVLGIAIHGQEVYAGGDGGPQGVIACGIARWDGSEWHPMGDGLSHCIYGEGAWDVQVAGDSVYVGGYFNDTGIEHTSCFAGWNGNEWFVLGEPATDPYLVPYQGGYVAAIQPHGQDIYIAGLFSYLGGVEGTRNIARWGVNKTTAVTPVPDPYTLSIEIFPNQTQGAFSYSFGKEDVLHTMSVYDACGREWIRETKNDMQGDVHSLPTGLYFLRIEVDGISGVARLLKM